MPQPNDNLPAKAELTPSAKFTNMVMKEFASVAGGDTSFTPREARLIQHLFVKVDTSLKAAETKRLDSKDGDKKTPIIWQNVNLNKLALDVVHRVNLGLDALVPNHIHVIPYMNKREKKYDLDLRIGYQGKDYYRRQVALVQPVNIIYELVYSTDRFVPLMKSFMREVESYEFEITKPFERGDVVGGFGYIMYENSTLNKLVLVGKRDFTRSETRSFGEFWKDHPIEMKYKTVVHRVTDKLTIDPEKVSPSFAAVEDEDHLELAEANEQVIDYTTGEIKPATAESAPSTDPDTGPGPDPGPEHLTPPF